MKAAYITDSAEKERELLRGLLDEFNMLKDGEQTAPATLARQTKRAKEPERDDGGRSQRCALRATA